jgi:hypothetical protein
LYPFPPALTTGDSDAVRIARVIGLFAAECSIPTPQPSTLPNPVGASSVINTSRATIPQVTLPTTPINPAPPPQHSAVAIPSPSKRKTYMMMHDDLKGLLDDAVYRELDAFPFHSVKEKDRIVTLCRTAQGAGFFNNTVTAPFGHQILLTLTKGEFFDPPIRGLALAIAGRSAAQPGTQSTTFGHGLSAVTAFQELRKRWDHIVIAWAALC